MTKKNDADTTRKMVFEFPVLAIIITLFSLGLGYYLEEKGLPSGLSGGRAVYLADYALLGKLCYISSGILLLIFAPLTLWNSKRKKKGPIRHAQKSLSDLQELSWREFEEYIWTLFSKLGYSLDGNGDKEPVDAGADLILKRAGGTSVVRCRKYYIRKVPLSMVRDFSLVLQSEPSLEKGYFITTGSFSSEARVFAAGKSIELIDGKRLMDFVRIADSIGFLQECSSGPDSPFQKGDVCPRCGASLEVCNAGSDAGSEHLFLECSMSAACEASLQKETKLPVEIVD